MTINLYSFFGAIAIITCIVLYWNVKVIEDHTLKYGKVIDKYKGRSSGTDADGQEYHTDNLYLVFEYPGEPIDRQSVSPDKYYKFYVGESVQKEIEHGYNTRGIIINCVFILSIICFIYGLIIGDDAYCYTYIG